jgi:hypothetical protein
MNSHYSLRFSLSGPGQPEILQALAKLGAESIQTGSGLCVKTELTLAELERGLAREKVTGLEISAVTGDLEPDVAAFVQQV